LAVSYFTDLADAKGQILWQTAATRKKAQDMPKILVDADACPVKEEIYKVAYRLQTPVTLVANAASLVVTADILLAGRCIEVGATVLGPTGKPFNTANIGSAIATRAIMADLRAGLEQTSGPAPFSAKDRSQFLNALDRELQRLKRG